MDSQKAAKLKDSKEDTYKEDIYLYEEPDIPEFVDIEYSFNTEIFEEEVANEKIQRRNQRRNQRRKTLFVK